MVAVKRKSPAAAGLPISSQLKRRRGRFLDQLKELSPRRNQDYIWLYRHYYPWLHEVISQFARPQKPAVEKADWNERDQLFAAQIHDNAALLYETDVRMRISATLLAKTTGKQVLIEKFAIKLPLTPGTT